ncbi:MAG: complex I subunit 1 family protein [Thermofilaceae archaeon]
MLEPLLRFVQALAYLLYTLLLALLLEWFDRKLIAKFQNRVGPHYTGPAGILQPLADVLKLLSKESVVPEGTDRLMFTLSPLLAFTIICTATAFVPLLGYTGLASLEGDVILVLALLTLYLLVIYTAGASSSSRFSLIGATRAALMLLGFEIPLMLSCLSVAASSGSFRISEIATQTQPRLLGIHALGFIMYLVAAQAELDRQPFDIPEAETEIVSGWLVEYSGWRLALFRLSKDVELVLLTGLAVALFMGGGPGIPLQGLELAVATLAFLIKQLFVVFILSLIRASFGRLRIDQFIGVGWRVLIPASFLYLVIAALVA